MGRAAIILIAFALVSCAQPVEPAPTPEPTTTAEAPQAAPEQPTEPEEPAWQPEPYTLYLFYDEPGGELYFSEVVTDPERWAKRYRAYKVTADINGYVFVAGEAP